MNNKCIINKLNYSRQKLKRLALVLSPFRTLSVFNRCTFRLMFFEANPFDIAFPMMFLIYVCERFPMAIVLVEGRTRDITPNLSPPQLTPMCTHVEKQIVYCLCFTVTEFQHDRWILFASKFCKVCPSPSPFATNDYVFAGRYTLTTYGVFARQRRSGAADFSSTFSTLTTNTRIARSFQTTSITRARFVSDTGKWSTSGR